MVILWENFNSMKRITLLLFISILISLTVLSQKEGMSGNINLSCYGLNDTLVKEWKEDLNGCKGLRVKYMSKIKGNDKLIGLTDTMILKLLGKPDDKNKFCYSYIIAPNCVGSKPKSNGTEFCTLIFYFNNHTLESIDIECT
jgi:hypothetical protein